MVPDTTLAGTTRFISYRYRCGGRVAALRSVAQASAICGLVFLSAPTSSRDLTSFFPRPAVAIVTAGSAPFLPVIHGFHATTSSLNPSPYAVDTEAEAKDLLIAARAVPTPYGFGGWCNWENIVLSDSSGWSLIQPGVYFRKYLNMDVDQVCSDPRGNYYNKHIVIPATLVSWMGCTDMGDSVLAVFGALNSPYDPMACVHRPTVDRPPCCDAKAGYGQGPMTMGNPIDFGLGRKVLIETDYLSAPDPRLSLVRYYEMHNSTPYLASPIGRDWNHSFNRALYEGGYVGPGVYSIGISEPNGHWTWFTQSGANFVSMFHPSDVLTKVDLGGGAYKWTRQKPDGTFETYDSSGRNIRIDSPSGRFLTIAYNSANRVAMVTNEVGRALTFAYGANGRVSRVTLPDGGSITYDYSTDNQPFLTAVRYPGGASRSYGYASLRLASVIDENGSPYMNVTYSSYGKATSSQLFGGVNRYAYTSIYASGSPIVWGNEGGTGAFALTTPLGATINFTTINVKGSIRPASVSLRCPECGVTDAALTYDAQANVTSRTDFNNRKVCYAYDLSRNLETARTEGILSTETCGTVLATLPSRPDVRKGSTQWHAVWRLPSKVAEPNRLTTNAYNGDGGMFCAPTTALVNGHPIGVLCSKTVQETTDTTGQQDFAATVTGTPRVWQYTYDGFGQVLTATDPNSKTTSNVYYAANDPDPGKRGNVRTITNPLGHVTTFTAYDTNGRPTTITDPNGTVTTLTYHPRGWLTARTVGVEQTTYDYDAVGQLTKATLPDGSYVQYMYDGAHRLTQVQDGPGNKIIYTLDAMGNRIKEQVYDPSGQLARVRQQVFDSLNRLHQSVGAR